MVFVLPAPSDNSGLSLEQDTSGGPDALSAADLSGSTVVPGYTANRNVGDTKFLMPSVTTSESNMAGGIGSAKSQMARPDYDPGEFEFQDSGLGQSGIRPARPFRFPMADVLDQWLPLAILGLMLLLSLSAAWNWRPSGALSETPASTSAPAMLPAWSGALPAALTLIAVLFIWGPLYRIASQQVAKSLKFALPDRMIVRSLAMGSLPLSLGAVFWFNAQSSAAGITGIVLGTGLSLLAGWFLLRLRQKEIPFVGIATVVASLAAAIVSCLAIWGANFATLQTVKATHQHPQFVVSPYGPDLQWEIPKSQLPEVQLAAKLTKKVAPPSSATKTTTPVPANPPSLDNTDTTTPDTSTNPQPTTPAETAVTAPPANQVQPTGVPAAQASNNNTATNGTTGTTPSVPVPAVKRTRPVRPAGSNPLIAASNPLPIGDVSGLIGPMGNSPVIAAITGDSAVGAEHTAQVYKLNPLTLIGDLPLSGDPVQTSLAVSGDGDLVARVSRGIVHEIVVRSFSKGTIVRKYTIDNRQTRLLGFVNKTTLLIEKRGQDYSLQFLDTATTKDTDESFWKELPSWMTAVYSDGKPVSGVSSTRVATVIPKRGTVNACLRIYRPSQPKLRQPEASIVGIETSIQTKPTGIAFSPDGKQVAITYEMANTIAVVVFANLDNPEPQCLGIHQFPLPAGAAETLAAPVVDPAAIEMVAPTALPTMPLGMTGMPHPMVPRPSASPAVGNTVRPLPAISNRLTSLDTNLWLYAGQYVLDGNTDQVAGSLADLGEGIGQHMADRTTAILLTNTDDGTNKLMQVQLKLPARAK